MHIIATTHDGRRFPYQPNTMDGTQPMRFASMEELETFLRRGAAASKTARVVRPDLTTIEVMIGSEVRVRYEAA